MNTLQLKREPAQGKAVTGFLDLPLGKDVLRIATLENADFLIPAGKYPLKMTYSPKFKKLMPEICEVPDRQGIRIIGVPNVNQRSVCSGESGAGPSTFSQTAFELVYEGHAREGCVLVSAFARQYIDYFMDKYDKEEDENESIQIEIC